MRISLKATISIQRALSNNFKNGKAASFLRQGHKPAQRHVATSAFLGVSPIQSKVESITAFQRTFLSNQKRSFQINKAYPNYAVLGDTFFQLKPIYPKFKHLGKDGVGVQSKGRMCLELAPSKPGTKMGYQWDQKIAFMLSVEEIGLLLSQWQHNRLVFTRQIGGDQQRGGFSGSGYDLVSTTTADAMDKVLTVEPGDGATARFQIDFVKDGIGGQIPPTNETSAPLEVVLQAGEMEVISTLMRDSIPYLTGWNKMLAIGVEHAVQTRERDN